MTKRQIINEYFSHGLKNLEPSTVIKAFAGEPEEIMTKKDFKKYETLPEYVTIYRGCDMDELEEGLGCPLGLSWTTDYKVAEFFAYRFGGDNKCVVKTVVSKDDISYFTDNRHEKEVIVFPFLIEEECEIVSSEVLDYDPREFHEYIEKTAS